MAVLVLAAAPLAAQNLFVNPDLDASLVPWVMGCGTQMSWQAADEAGCPGSGSAHLTSGPCGGGQGSGAGQCVAAAGFTTISVSGRVRASSGTLVTVLEFHDAAACAGNVLGTVFVPAGAGTGNWQTVTAVDRPVPAGTVTVLIGVGAAGAGTVDADIDAGYAGERQLVFRDDFEGNLGGTPPICRWSVVSP